MFPSSFKQASYKNVSWVSRMCLECQAPMSFPVARWVQVNLTRCRQLTLHVRDGKKVVSDSNHNYSHQNTYATFEIVYLSLALVPPASNLQLRSSFLRFVYQYSAIVD
jgi:hypothetical protein